MKTIEERNELFEEERDRRYDLRGWVVREKVLETVEDIEKDFSLFKEKHIRMFATAKTLRNLKKAEKLIDECRTEMINRFKADKIYEIFPPRFFPPITMETIEGWISEVMNEISNEDE